MSVKECFAIALLLLVAVALVGLAVILSVVIIKIDPCYFIAAVGLFVLSELIKLYVLIDEEAHAEYERRLFERKRRNAK